MTTASQKNTEHIVRETARVKDTDPELWAASEATRVLINDLLESNDIQWNEDIGLGAIVYADFIMNTIREMVMAAQEILQGDREGVPAEIRDIDIVDTADVLTNLKLIKFLQALQLGVMRSAVEELDAVKVA